MRASGLLPPSGEKWSYHFSFLKVIQPQNPSFWTSEIYVSQVLGVGSLSFKCQQAGFFWGLPPWLGDGLGLHKVCPLSASRSWRWPQSQLHWLMTPWPWPWKDTPEKRMNILLISSPGMSPRVIAFGNWMEALKAKNSSLPLSPCLSLKSIFKIRFKNTLEWKAKSEIILFKLVISQGRKLGFWFFNSIASDQSNYSGFWEGEMRWFVWRTQHKARHVTCCLTGALQLSKGEKKP